MEPWHREAFGCRGLGAGTGSAPYPRGSSRHRLVVTRWPRTGPSGELLSTVLPLQENSWHETRLNCLQGPGPDVVCAPCAGSRLISPGRTGDGQADAAPAGQQPEPGTAVGAGIASSWCGMAWRGTAWHGAAWCSAAQRCQSTTQPLEFVGSHGQPGRHGRVTAGSGTCGCCWHQRDWEQHRGHDGSSPSAGAGGGSCPGTRQPCSPFTAPGNTHRHKA